MQIQMIYELNHTFMSVSGDEIEDFKDYRYRMLDLNKVKEILPLEIRSINNEKKLYVDVTGKENALNYFNCKLANREEVRKLFEAIYVISDYMGRFLINETDIILRPEMIFRDMKTGEYEFVCIPLRECEGENEGMKALVQFLMMHLDNSDDKLVTAVYSVNDMYMTSTPKFAIAYDLFANHIMEEYEAEKHEEEIYEEETVTEEKERRIYFPSLKELGAFALCLVGIILLGYNLYLYI